MRREFEDRPWLQLLLVTGQASLDTGRALAEDIRRTIEQGSQRRDDPAVAQRRRSGRPGVCWRTFEIRPGNPAKVRVWRPMARATPMISGLNADPDPRDPANCF
jgi:hypothetical protein